MKKFKNSIIKILLSIFITTTFFACDKVEDSNSEGTKTKNFAGDWFIIGLESNGTTPAFGGTYNLFSTYNAASNDENFWIDDHDSFFELKTKVQAKDFNNLIFAGQPNSDELYTETKVTVTNGKILKNAAKSFGGHIVDSIYFELEYSSDPGVIYKMQGHRRTGFKEDELP